MRHPQGQELLHQEIWQGEFSRSFTLPLAVDADKTTATYHNGILTITMAESEATKPRKIEVRAGLPAIGGQTQGVQKETVPVWAK